jgi:hypothetical protein
VYHVSFVRTFSFGVKSLPLPLLTASEVAFKSGELLRLRDEPFVFRTAKGYIAMEAMKFYVNSIFGPYVKSPRDQFFDQSLTIYLVADSRGTHTNPDILTLLQRTGAVPIWLLPHGSYFL